MRAPGPSPVRPVLVAVVDSGWDRARAEPRVLAGRAFSGNPADDHDRLGHGTACIEAVLRHAPAGRVLPVRVFGAEPETSAEVLAAAIRSAAAAGADVIALSLGTRLKEARPLLEGACIDARAAGALLIAAGPNAGPPTLPACLPMVIGVWPAAGGGGGERFRVRCRDTLDLEVLADEGCRMGTSLAAAEVAGRLATLLAQGWARDPSRLIEGVGGGPSP